ncbi:MAG: hypothetical protein WC852_03685 [Candidatus Nanoarchaeia archaeon]
MKARIIGIVAAAGLAALVAGCKEKASPNCVHSDCTMDITPENILPEEGIFENGEAGWDWTFGYQLETKEGMLTYRAKNGLYVSFDLTNVCWENRMAQIHMVCISEERPLSMIPSPENVTPRYCRFKASHPDYCNANNQEACQKNGELFEAAARQLSHFYEIDGEPEHCN